MLYVHREEISQHAVLVGGGFELTLFNLIIDLQQ